MSRFGESWSGAWEFSKDEALKAPEDFAGFDVLLTGNFTFHAARFDTVDVLPGQPLFLPRELRVRTQPTIYVMRRKQDALQFKAAKA